MGLFGGFKAKFLSSGSRNEKTNKHSGSGEIVCLRYHVISEFDRQGGTGIPPPPPIRADIKKGQVIKKPSLNQQRPSIIGKENKIFKKTEEPTTQKPTSEREDKIIPSTKQKSKKQPTTTIIDKPPITKTNKTENYSLSTSVEVPIKDGATSLTVANTTFNRNVENIPNGISETKSIEMNSQELVFVKNKPEKFGKHKSILKSITTSHQDDTTTLDRYQDQSSLIYSQEGSSLRKTKSEEHISKNSFEYSGFSKTATYAYDSSKTSSVEDFNIDVTRSNVTYHKSENDLSVKSRNFDSVNSAYSSQAASIFFGGEEEDVVRPRNVKLDDSDDEQRRESADC